MARRVKFKSWRVGMKKYGFLLLAGLLTLGACATIPISPISPGDVPSFKGTWEGYREMIWGRFRSYDPAIMEVSNDAIPLKGKLTIVFMEGTDTRVFQFDNGTIDPQGNLVLPLKEDTKALLSFHKGEGKMKLDGYYYYGGYIGRLTLDKK
jgi:hypothetical protein